MPHMELENRYGRGKGRIVCGVDEVGRGPLAGPVMAAAVIVPEEGLPSNIATRVDDSKKLSARQREHLFDDLTKLCRYAIGEVSVEDIDRINILQASMLAMQRAVSGLDIEVECALVDGNRAPNLPCNVVPVVKGDGISLSIASASIIAKVARDRLMTKLAEQYPGYGWDRNAGYPTAQHREALQRLGLTPWHRRSFAPVSQYILLTG